MFTHEGRSLGRVREPVPVSSECLIRMGRKSTRASLLSPEKAGVKDQSFGHKIPTRGRFWFPKATLKFDMQESPLFQKWKFPLAGNSLHLGDPPVFP